MNLSSTSVPFRYSGEKLALIHEAGDTVIGSLNQICLASGLSTGRVISLLDGQVEARDGWRVDSNRCLVRVKSKSGRTASPFLIVFRHEKLGCIAGTRNELAEALGISVDVISKLRGGYLRSVRGWFDNSYRGELNTQLSARRSKPFLLISSVSGGYQLRDKANSKSFYSGDLREVLQVRLKMVLNGELVPNGLFVTALPKRAHIVEHVRTLRDGGEQPYLQLNMYHLDSRKYICRSLSVGTTQRSRRLVESGLRKEYRAWVGDYNQVVSAYNKLRLDFFIQSSYQEICTLEPVLKRLKFDPALWRQAYEQVMSEYAP